MRGDASSASTSSSSKSSLSSSRPSNTNSPSGGQNLTKSHLRDETIEAMYHNTFGTSNYHFIGNPHNQNISNINTNVYSINGTATTSSGGSSSGYDTLSITTALGAQHLNDNSNTSSCSGSSANTINNRSQQLTASNKGMIMNVSKPDDTLYGDMNRDELNRLMNDAIVGFYIDY